MTVARFVARQEAVKIKEDLRRYGRAYYVEGRRVDPRLVVPVYPMPKEKK